MPETRHSRIPAYLSSLGFPVAFGLLLAFLVSSESSAGTLQREFISDWFELDTRIDANGTDPMPDENASGYGDGPRFTLDTRDDPDFPDTNQSGYADGPRFTLDTRDDELDENRPPVMTGWGGDSPTSINLLEGEVYVGRVTATDSDGDVISYFLAGGPDAAKFTLNVATGELSFASPPSHANPGDVGLDNVYQVEVSASDGKASVGQVIFVTVTAKEARSGHADGPRFTLDTRDELPPPDPITIVLSNDTIMENREPGAPVGVFSITGGVSSSSGAPASFPAYLQGDLAVYYPLDGDAKDASGNGRHGKTAGKLSIGPEFATFDGKDDRLVCPYDAPEENLTISCLFSLEQTRFNGAKKDFTLFQLYGAWNKGWRVHFDELGQGKNLINEGPSGMTHFAPNVWRHAAMTVSGDKNVRMYLDGNPVGDSFQLKNNPNWMKINVGAWRQISYSKHFAGNLDEFRVFDRALDASEVKTLSRVGRSEGPVFELVPGVGSADNDLYDLQPAGELRTAYSFDYESENNIHSILVRASDPGGATAEEAFPIRVLDEPENRPPVITSWDGSPAVSLSVKEGEDAVGRVRATDPDGDVLTYFLAGGTDAGKFILDSFSGEIAFATIPYHANPTDADKDNVYEVEVIVSDGRAVAVQGLSVTVIAEGAKSGHGDGPRFTLDTRDVVPPPLTENVLLLTNAVPENMPPGVLVGALLVVETAQEPGQAGYEFVLAPDDSGKTYDNDFFSIDAFGGLRSLQSFDYETRNEYWVHVEARPVRRGETLRTPFLVKVSDVDENVRLIDLVLAGNRVRENEQAGALAGYLTPIIDGEAPAETIRYELLQGSQNLEIRDRKLVTKRPLDFESNASVPITVRATLGLGEPLERNFLVEVEDVLENRGPTRVRLRSSGVRENAGVDAWVGQFTADDPDPGDWHVFTLVGGTGGDDNALFRIDANGSLRALEDLDFETVSEHEVRVRATDPYGKSVESAVTVTVLDDHVDNLPDFKAPLEGILTGLVLAKDGTLLPRGDFALYDAKRSQPERFPVFFSVSRGLDGFFEIKVPFGEYYIQASGWSPDSELRYDPQYWQAGTSGAGKRGKSVVLSPDNAQIDDMEFRLAAIPPLPDPGGETTAKLQGMVVDEDGLPVAGATVEARLAGRETDPHPHLATWTKDDGSFELLTYAGTFALTAYHWNGKREPANQTVTVGQGEERLDLRFTLKGRDEMTINGHVLSPEGTPVAATLFFEDEALGGVEVVPLDGGMDPVTGKFSFVLPRGGYRIRASDWSGRYGDTWYGGRDRDTATVVELLPGSSEMYNVDILMTRSAFARVLLTVTENGIPLSFPPALEFHEHDTSGMFWGMVEFPFAEPTGIQGQYAFELSPGTWNILFYPPWPLDPMMGLYDPMFGMGMGTMLAYVGDGQIHAWEDAMFSPGVPFALSGGQTLDLGTLELSNYAAPPWLPWDPGPDPLPTLVSSISGQVLAPDGSPVPRAEVQAVNGGGWIVKNAFTDGEGNFRFEDLPPDLWSLTAFPPWEDLRFQAFRETSAIEINLPAGGEEKITLKLLGTNVRGKVMAKDSSGKYMAPSGGWWWIYLDENGDGMPDAWTMPMPTATGSGGEVFGDLDSSGAFAVSLDQGRYVMEIELFGTSGIPIKKTFDFEVSNPAQTITLGDKARVSWEQQPEASMGYRVEGGHAGTGRFELLAEVTNVEALEAFVSLPFIAGAEQDYRVRALREDGEFLIPSDQVKQGTPFLALAPPENFVEGSIMDQLGEPVPDVVVGAFSWMDGRYAETRTGKDGKYRLVVGEGIWDIEIFPDPRAPIDWSYSPNQFTLRTVDFPPGAVGHTQTVNFSVERRHPEVKVKVRGFFEKPDGARDWALWPGMAEVWFHGPEGSLGGPVEANGEFTFTVPTGFYEVFVWVDPFTGYFLDEIDSAHMDPTMGERPYRSITIPAGSDFDMGAIRLTRLDSTISGTVKDSGGKAVPNAMISAWTPWGDYRSAMTDASGRYSLSVPPGEWTIQCDFAPNPDAVGIPFLPSEPKFLLVDISQQTNTVDFSLHRLSREITGTLISPPGFPGTFLGMMVYARKATPGGIFEILTEVPVDERGRFTLFVPDGEKVVVGVWPDWSGLFPEAPEVEVGTDETTVILSFGDNGATITGTLTLNGQPATGWMGEVYGFRMDGPGDFRVASLGPDGNFSFSVPPGIWMIDYNVFMVNNTYDGFMPYPTMPAEIVVAAGEAKSVAFDLKSFGTMKIIGKIIDESGVAVIGPCYVDIGVPGLGDPASPALGYWQTRETLDGTFSFEVPAAGSYEIFVYPGPELRMSDFMEPAPQVVRMGEGETASVEVIMPKFSVMENSSLEGKVVDPLGHSLVGAFVWAWSPTGPAVDGFTDQQGRFSLAVPNGYEWFVGADYFDPITGAWYSIFIESGPWRTPSGEITVSLSDFASNVFMPPPIGEFFDPRYDYFTILPDGTEVLIPSGAVPVDASETLVQLVINPTMDGLAHDLAGSPVGYGYSIEILDSRGRKVDANFRKPVRLTIPLDPFFMTGMGLTPNDIDISYYDPARDSWVAAEVAVVDPILGMIQVYVDHFSLWAPTAKPNLTVPLTHPLGENASATSSPNWYSSSWFGSFHAINGTDWVYHETHGWIYVQSDGSNGYWIFDAALSDWLWVSPEAYSAGSSHYLFSTTRNTWIWHSPGTINPRWFFDYAKQGWFTDDGRVRITTESSLNEGGSVTGAGDYPIGTIVTLEAIPSPGYVFAGWAGTISSPVSTYSFIVTEIADFKANFRKLPDANITVAVSGNGSGKISGGGQVPHGTTVTLEATAEEGSLFQGWWESNTLLSKDTTLSFTGSSSRNLEARFDRTTVENLLELILSGKR